MQWDDYTGSIIALYKTGMSGNEVSEYIYRETEVNISPRSIQRIVAKAGVAREIGEAFRNAMKRGRVIWQLEEDKKRREKTRVLSKGLRYQVLQRDKFRCQICGTDSKSGGLLQVDHIKAKVHGGSDELENLRTLCLECNIGKRVVEKESGFGGGFKETSS